MENSYSYTLSDLNEVCHFVLPNEKEYGMQNTILKNVGSELAEPFKAQSHLVNKLFAENEPRDVVFMQVTGPGKAFETYEKERFKLPITLKAYVELLNFFAKEYPRIFSRIEADTSVMTAGVEWLSMTPSISFKGPANICFKKTLLKNIHYSLAIYIERLQEIGKRRITLKYTNEEMGMLYIHPPALTHLAKERATIAELQNYKEVSMPKRSRQS